MFGIGQGIAQHPVGPVWPSDVITRRHHGVRGRGRDDPASEERMGLRFVGGGEDGAGHGTVRALRDGMGKVGPGRHCAGHGEDGVRVAFAYRAQQGQGGQVTEQVTARFAAL